MDKSTDCDFDGIKAILSKLIVTRNYSELTSEDIEVLSRFADIEQSSAPETGRKTFLSWIWINLVKFNRYIGFSQLFDITLLAEVITGEKERTFTGFISGEVLCTFLSRAELIEMVRETIYQAKSSLIDSHSRLEGAVCLAGLAGLVELEKDLADLCFEKFDDNDVGFKYYGSNILSATFVSLVMLNSRYVEQVRLKLRAINDDPIKSALYFFYDTNTDKIPEDELSELRDYLPEYEYVRKFPFLALTVFESDPKILNKIIAGNPYDSDSSFNWDFVGQTATLNRNQKLLHEIVRQDDRKMIQRILLLAILNNSIWMLPDLQKQIDLLKKRAADEDSESIIPYYIITAGALSNDTSEWLKQFLASGDINTKVSAVLACTGKSNFLSYIQKLKEGGEPLVSAAASFVVAQSEDLPLTYLESLMIEMKILGLNPGLSCFIYCLLKSRSDRIPPELTDLWLMAGPYDHELSVEFYKTYPYRLIAWFFPDKQRRALPDFQSTEEIEERCMMILKSIADSRYAGLLKTLLYTIDNETVGLVLLSHLVELEGSLVSDETRVIRKIMLSEQSKPIEFEKDELFYALLFFLKGKYNRKPGIISGIQGNPDFLEAFYRLIAETEDASSADSAFNAIKRNSGINELLLKEPARILNGSGLDGKEPDFVSLSRLMMTKSDKFRSEVIVRMFNSTEREKFVGLISEENRDNGYLYMLMFLMMEDSVTTVGSVVDAIAKIVGNSSWMEESVNRWFRSGDQFLMGYPFQFEELAIRAAGIIKSEKLLPELIRVSYREDPYGLNKGKYLNVIESILSEDKASRYILLRADDPDKVIKAYNVNVKRDYNLNSDNKAECIRIISLAYGKMADISFVKGHEGKSVTINHEKDHFDPSLANECLTRDEFEKLALYLSVTYTDESTGLIFAEVMDPDTSEPTVAVINAILQKDVFAVFTVSWS